MARLIVCGNDGRPARVFEAEQSVITLGRSSDNHLQIDDLNSSRHHCEIHENEGVYEVVDKDSRNGIFVNGHRVARQILQPGDKIEIGTTIIYLERMGTETLEDPRGKQTIDIQTGIFSAPGDPTGVKERLQSFQETGRITRPPEEETSASGPQGELQDLRRLLGLNEMFNSELNLRRLLERVMDTVIHVSGAERGFLVLKLGKDRDFQVKVSRNIDRESIKDAREKVSSTLVSEVLEHGRSVLLSDAGKDERYSGRESILSMKLRSVLVVPLRHRDDVQGAIYLDNRFASNRFDEKCREQLELVGGQAAVAIENARLFEENCRQREELQHAKEELERLNQALRERVEVQDRELVRAREALARHREDMQLKYSYDEIITQSPKMLEVFMILDKVVDSKVSVLIQGESGTGKELIARALHYNGARKKQTFVSENCAAIPAHLMESEFFGYVRGAFTGANADKIGLFELADGGTLFLDEIGDMDLDMQTKLLRVLQDGVLRRVGSKEFKKVDVRIVSATNRDLLSVLKSGGFREDLYYRLNVINILLPPLRDRKEDVPLLSQHFIERDAKKAKTKPAEISSEAMDLLMRYEWPGNVRELENEIMRASALSQGVTIRPEHLSKNVVAGAQAPARATAATGSHVRSLTLAGRTLKELVSKEVEQVEGQVIREVLRRTGYKKSKSSSILGISRPTLDAKIEKYGLTKEAVLADDGAEG